tara:strand:+ start:407 stop:757 length:351 start_codon:yes stop_codon:yes gene_type:complete
MKELVKKILMFKFNEIPPEIEILIRAYELDIRRLSNEERLEELIILKTCHEQTFYDISKFLENYGISFKRHHIETEDNEKLIGINFDFISPRIKKIFKKEVIPVANYELKKIHQNN